MFENPNNLLLGKCSETDPSHKILEAEEINAAVLRTNLAVGSKSHKNVYTF